MRTPAPILTPAPLPSQHVRDALEICNCCLRTRISAACSKNVLNFSGSANTASTDSCLVKTVRRLLPPHPGPTTQNQAQTLTRIYAAEHKCKTPCTGFEGGGSAHAFKSVSAADMPKATSQMSKSRDAESKQDAGPSGIQAAMEM